MQQKWWTPLLSATWCLWRQHFRQRHWRKKSREFAVRSPHFRIQGEEQHLPMITSGEERNCVMRGPKSVYLEVPGVECTLFCQGATSWERFVLELGVYVRIHKLVTETCVNTFMWIEKWHQVFLLSEIKSDFTGCVMRISCVNLVMWWILP